MTTGDMRENGLLLSWKSQKLSECSDLPNTRLKSLSATSRCRLDNETKGHHTLHEADRQRIDGMHNGRLEMLADRGVLHRRLRLSLSGRLAFLLHRLKGERSRHRGSHTARLVTVHRVSIISRQSSLIGSRFRLF